jgi:GrpB-like predicted nucleotidyltransferase (UPF0157 family)
MKPVAVVPYDARWPEFYERERSRLAEVLGDEALAIEHMGSTSVPRLDSKPIIDIMVGVETLARDRELIEAVEQLGYVYHPEFEDTLPERRFLARHGAPELAPGASHTGYQVHIFEFTDPWWGRNLRFRDYLRTHPDDARRYGDLKRELALKMPEDRDRYQVEKSPLILELMAIADGVEPPGGAEKD